MHGRMALQFILGLREIFLKVGGLLDVTRGECWHSHLVLQAPYMEHAYHRRSGRGWIRVETVMSEARM